MVLKMPAAAPAFVTGTVLTAALSITPNASPTPAPNGSSGSASAGHDAVLRTVTSRSAPAAINAEAPVSTARTELIEASRAATSGSSNTGAVIGSRSRPLTRTLRPPTAALLSTLTATRLSGHGLTPDEMARTAAQAVQGHVAAAHQHGLTVGFTGAIHTLGLVLAALSTVGAVLTFLALSPRTE